MFNPPHPASILREDVLPDLGLTVTEAARQLGVTRAQLSPVLHERAAITPDMALRLEQWISGLRAQTWLRLQADYAPWQAEHKGRLQVERAHPVR